MYFKTTLFFFFFSPLDVAFSKALQHLIVSLACRVGGEQEEAIWEVMVVGGG